VRDPIFRSFLQRSHDEAMALAASSDLLELEPLAGSPPTRFIARFGCRGLVCRNNIVQEAEQFAVGFNFPAGYLQSAPEPLRMLTWLGPQDVHHPNILGPFICVGKPEQGAGLADLLFLTFGLITYQSVTMNENDALNSAACAWARRHVHELPIDPRPLRWRRANGEPGMPEGTP
jgi:hypothetical protein